MTLIVGLRCACPERPSTPGAWRLTLRVTGEAPVRPEPFDKLRTGFAKRSRRKPSLRANPTCPIYPTEPAPLIVGSSLH